jgi:hypothetical protein
MTFTPSSIASALPDFAKELVSPLYFKYQSRAADSVHTPPAATSSQKRGAPDHILLLVVDALRPDVSLDIGLEFTTGISAATWTFPSVTSMITGERPSNHGAVAHTHPDDEEYAMPQKTNSRLALAKVLEATGYDTYGGFAFLTPLLALRGGFQTHRVYNDARAETVLRKYQSWRQSRECTFGYLHLGDLHAPIDPPQEYIEAHGVDESLPNLPGIVEYKTDFDPEDEECRYYRKHKLRLYNAAAEYVSDCLRPFVSEYEDSTAILLVGDHGESLWEYQSLDRQISDSRPNYCFGHGGTPFDSLARVPVGVSEKVPSPTGGWPSLRDVAPTLINIAVEDTPVPGHGWHDPIPENRAVVCEATRYGAERKAVYRGNKKLIRSETDDVTLTATVNPDGEQFETFSPDLASELLSELPDEWYPEEDLAQTSPMVQDQLEALGYK